MRMQFVGRTGTFTYRMLATVLAAQSILLFFGALVARGTAIAAGKDGGRVFAIGCALAVLAVLAAGLMRTPFGLPLGWLVQVLTWASAVWVPMMLAVGLVFTALWAFCLLRGPRAEALVAEHRAAAEADADHH